MASATFALCARSILRLALLFLLIGLNPLARRAGADAGQPSVSAQAAPAASSEDARAALERSGLDPAEIRRRLREAGLPESALDSYLASPGATAPDRPRQQSPATAPVTAPAAPAPAPTPIPAPEKTVAPAADAMTIEPFGYEIFRYSPTTFEPLAYGPVDPDYPVGPGDELILTVWGDAQLSASLVVNREGYVSVPDVGQVPVSGLTLEGARSRLRSALANIYSGLRPSGRRSTTFVDVSLGKLRSIQVFLLGQVVRPGGYTVSSVARVLHALYAAGGPTREGTLRDVRLMRNGQRVTSVDLYDMLLRGDASRDVRLQNGDVIFLPAAGRRVMVLGAARRPGMFELSIGEGLRALLQFAGGLMPSADMQRGQIERVVPPEQRAELRGQDRVLIDVPLAEVIGDLGRDLTLLDGDRLTILQVGDRLANVVAIHGTSVLRPGTFEHRPGMTVRDLVTQAGGLMPDAYLDRAQITRTAPDRSRSVVRVHLGSAMAGDPRENVGLEPLDQVTVLSKWDMIERPRVGVYGMVRHPGEYELLEGMTLADLLFQAGGLTEDAWSVRAEVARVGAARERAGADTLMVALDREFARSAEATAFALEKRDAVFIRRDPRYREQFLVQVSGEVKYPGAYALTRRDERVADLVRRAGDFTDLANPRGAVFTRRGGRLAVDLPDAMRNKGSRSNVTLEPGDELRIPRADPTVRIEGAVRNPVVALYRSGMGIGYYITQASGYRPDADRRGTVVVMANGDVRRGITPEPGSRITVPTRLEERQTDRLKDLSSVLGLIASAATGFYLIQQASR